jgi:hypothetical protein
MANFFTWKFLKYGIDIIYTPTYHMNIYIYLACERLKLVGQHQILILTNPTTSIRNADMNKKGTVRVVSKIVIGDRFFLFAEAV